MTSTTGEFLSSLASNAAFAGVIGGAGAGAVLYELRAAPGKLWGWVKRRISVSLVIDNSEDLFDRLSIYLSTSPFVRRARWLRMVELYDFQEQKWKWTAAFGVGCHFFRDHGRWYLLHRALDEKSTGMTLQRRETMTLRTFGTSQVAMRALMDRAEKVYESIDAVRIHVWHKGTYLLADYKPKRSLDTIFVPDEQKRRLTEDLTTFLGARERYRRRGTPYRRGYLLEGPPGTGKTSLAFVLACYADRPVYMVNLNTAGGDTGLQVAFNTIEAGSVVVIEDIDTAKITHDRSERRSDEVQIKPDEHVTLSGLLNVIDGLATRDNRILIVTSNHADKLDPALLRPGRIDHREIVGLIEEPEARRMAAMFGQTQEWFDAKVLKQLPMSPATLQGMLQTEGVLS